MVAHWTARIGREPSSAGFKLFGLFFLPFLLVGIGAGVYIAKLNLDWALALGWVEMQATVVPGSVSREGGVSCRYTYRFEGVDYEGSRVGFTDGVKSDFGPDDKRFHALKEAAERGEPVPCYVDPGAPTRSRLYRRYPWEHVLFLTLFCLIFGAVGGVGTFGASIGDRGNARGQALKDAHPKRPWRWESRWSDARIRPQTGPTLVVAWIFTGIWCLVSVPGGLLGLSMALHDRLYWGYLALLFPALAVLILVATVRQTLVYLKFGRTVLELETLPGVIGGHLRGTLRLSGWLWSLRRIRLRLQCVRTVLVGTGDDRTYETFTVWEDTVEVPVSASRAGQSELPVPFDFIIPHTCRPCDESNPADSVAWTLKVGGKSPGPDLDLDFRVPVFRTKDSDPSITEGGTFRPPGEPVLPDLHRIEVHEDVHGWKEFVVSCWQGMAYFVFVAALGCAFAVGCAFSVSSGSVFDLFLGIFAVVCAWGCVRMLGRYRVRFSADHVDLACEHGPFVRRSRVDRRALAGAEYALPSVSQQPRYYFVNLVRRDGVKTRAVSLIKKETTAQWLVEQFEEQIQREP